MKNCKVCKDEIDFRRNLKSLLNRYGEITCSNCNSKFRIKNSFISHIMDFIILLITIVIMDKIGGLLGIILGSLFPISIILIQLNTDSRYIQVK
ncbi:hypothetical protein PN290_14065 [Romboutsia sp. 1001216sp1]|uniref:hypothetical protein n=2 Tax=unclassified Romboutsia TaxID=2626894 RepID=UPI00189F3B64|nr:MULTISPECIES: hypothetical protein [unclassified Romboutsia]MDB8791355.1 hypothetical protein [Romboutsia sp. 1001216sp1]MDB8797662.1 hypothetical protein [Romboutsia sp. 1001216sp1]MDB8800491.1 hypothetical protein [Romboutsia sp. 1001216sp1]MDB8803317.1 hypothetical protein [Romboutsia sp. 1001216sp1]MDB8814714.1 hypothetical protein [Romboutsia sp. 1001216sp1]